MRWERRLTQMTQSCTVQLEEPLKSFNTTISIFILTNVSAAFHWFSHLLLWPHWFYLFLVFTRGTSSSPPTSILLSSETPLKALCLVLFSEHYQVRSSTSFISASIPDDDDTKLDLLTNPATQLVDWLNETELMTHSNSAVIKLSSKLWESRSCSLVEPPITPHTVKW